MFSEKIIQWYEENQRVLPWRGTRDPYKIWLSEIILQQTRIEQGRAYYERFVAAFPTVADLAKASEEQVLKMWQGLGYYSRARNLHAAARYIVSERHGEFPATYEDVLALKGVGRYTAAAIVSFAYRLPYPVIDGNVYRLVARLFGITTPIGTAAYGEFEQRLLRLIDRNRPDLFNQAMMDFGSTYCKPVRCDCERCIFRDECDAYKTGRVALLPVRRNAAKARTRFFYYFDVRWRDGKEEYTIIRQRRGRDIWRGLYDYPLLESAARLDMPALTEEAARMISHLCGIGPADAETALRTGAATATAEWTATHRLTHQTIEATFLRLALPASPIGLPQELTPIPVARLDSYPVSRLIELYLQR